MNYPPPSTLDHRLTEFVDADRHWGPLLFLRPCAEEAIGWGRVLVLSLLIGTGFGLLGNILLALAARLAQQAAPPPYIFPLTLTALYFCICQMTFVPVWNRRAQKLAGRKV